MPEGKREEKGKGKAVGWGGFWVVLGWYWGGCEDVGRGGERGGGVLGGEWSDGWCWEDRSC